MAGTLWIAAANDFSDQWKEALGVAISVEATSMLVYQAPSGRTGLDADQVGESLIYDLLDGATICPTPTEKHRDFFPRQTSFEEDVLSFLGSAGSDPVAFVADAFHDVNLILEFDEYVTESKRNVLRSRYGKPVEELLTPILLGLSSEHPHQRFSALDALYRSAI